MTRSERELDITYWLLDTRSLWPGEKITDAVRFCHFLTDPPASDGCYYYYPPIPTPAS